MSSGRPGPGTRRCSRRPYCPPRSCCSTSTCPTWTAPSSPSAWRRSHPLRAWSWRRAAGAPSPTPAAARSPGGSLLLAVAEAVAGWRLRVDAPLGRRASGRTASTATCLLAAALALPAVVRLLWPHVVDGYLLVDAYCAL